jgi:hypothetical protein
VFVPAGKTVIHYGAAFDMGSCSDCGGPAERGPSGAWVHLDRTRGCPVVSRLLAELGYGTRPRGHPRDVERAGPEWSDLLVGYLALVEAQEGPLIADLETQAAVGLGLLPVRAGAAYVVICPANHVGVRRLIGRGVRGQRVLPLLCPVCGLEGTGLLLPGQGQAEDEG